jgi:hypothetical protein
MSWTEGKTSASHAIPRGTANGSADNRIMLGLACIDLISPSISNNVTVNKPEPLVDGRSF